MPVTEIVTQLSKTMVWNMICLRGLSNLQIMFLGLSMTSEFYVKCPSADTDDANGGVVDDEAPEAELTAIEVLPGM